MAATVGSGFLDAIVVANGDVDLGVLRALVLARPGATILAADGGARAVLDSGLRPDVVIGDGDSLSGADLEHLRADGVEMRIAPPAKDESDTELCLLAAVREGASRIAICGAFGGTRPEHLVANLLLLADPRFDDIEIVLHAGASRIQRIGGAQTPGALDVSGALGDLVSLFPVGGAVTGVRTTRLRYPLNAETLSIGPARGLSNEMTDRTARITSESGSLLVVITPRAALDPPPDGGIDP